MVHLVSIIILCKLCTIHSFQCFSLLFSRVDQGCGGGRPEPTNLSEVELCIYPVGLTFVVGYHRFKIIAFTRKFEEDQTFLQFFQVSGSALQQQKRLCTRSFGNKWKPKTSTGAQLSMLGIFSSCMKASGDSIFVNSRPHASYLLWLNPFVPAHHFYLERLVHGSEASSSADWPWVFGFCWVFRG